MMPHPHRTVRVACASIRGAHHRLRNLPRQDAAACRRATPDLPSICLALADGHGDPRCARSRTGARFAVHAALDALQSLAASDLACVAEAMLQPWWRQSLVQRWQQSVAAHLLAFPPGPDEIARLREFPAAPSGLLYGTTLLAGLAGPCGWLFLQIGDGDVLTLWPNGEVRRIWPRPQCPDTGQTDSLCLPDAAHRIRLALLPASQELPKLALLSTDGYANSFASDSDFLQVAGDLRHSIELRGWTPTVRQLPAWLRETSEAGSGDDISLGIITSL